MNTSMLSRLWSFKLGLWHIEHLAGSEVGYLLQNLQPQSEEQIEDTLYRKAASGKIHYIERLLLTSTCE